MYVFNSRTYAKYNFLCLKFDFEKFLRDLGDEGIFFIAELLFLCDTLCFP